MDFKITNERIAELTGCPAVNVVNNWPLLKAALDKHLIGSVDTCVAAIATIRVECPGFKPIHEFGSERYFTEHYENRSDLGNIHPGDGARYCGRGYIQLTGRKNYSVYGHLLGIDLEGQPDLALQPAAASEIFSLYFRNKGCNLAADNKDWTKVRKLVNGGTNGLDLFLKTVNSLVIELGTQTT